MAGAVPGRKIQHAEGAAHRPRAYTTHDGPLFFAHRGGAGLAPENTMVAFEQGVSYGANALELDIQMTRDGEIVVMHDPLVDRTTDGSGPVSRYSLAELRRLDAGYAFTPDGGLTYPYRGKGIVVPTLREIYERFPDLRINIDLKESDEPRERRLWRLIRELGADDRTLVASSEDSLSIARFRRISGGAVATSACKSEIRAFVISSWLFPRRRIRRVYDALQVPETYKGIRVVTPRFVRHAHAVGLDVHVWTVDEAPAMERLLSWGVDGIMTDRPDVLADVLRAARVNARP